MIRPIRVDHTKFFYKWLLKLIHSESENFVFGIDVGYVLEEHAERINTATMTLYGTMWVSDFGHCGTIFTESSKSRVMLSCKAEMIYQEGFIHLTLSCCNAQFIRLKLM